MSTNYAAHVSAKKTPQSEQARADQVQNSAGGYAFALDPWKRLDRWLVLGAEGGTYYATERALVKSNATTIADCLRLDPKRAVDRIAEMSDTGRIPKNDTAIFALALAAASDSEEARRHAYAAVPKVCRIGTHVMHFARAVEQMRGWGRGLRRAVAKWYTDQGPADLAHQVAKYQQRDGWSNRDLLRLSHAVPPSDEHNAIFRWCVGGLEAFDRETKKGKAPSGFALPRAILALEEAKRAKDEATIVRLIREDRLTHEMVPSEWKNSAAVWEALLEHMPIGAMVRNLGKMSAVGLLKPLSSASRTVAERLGDRDRIKKARLHPIAILSALKTYQQGHGQRGSLRWTSVPQVTDALDAAFYLAFDAVTPAGKRTLIALDVSGSMDGGEIAGVPGLTPRIGSAAMAMVLAKTEPAHHCVGFTSAHGRWGGYGGRWGGGEAGLTPIDLSRRKSLDDVIRAVAAMPMGGTDCALPMTWAAANKIEVDTFTIWTDSETWHGQVHPYQALKLYRDAMGIPAKLVVVGMVANEFTIADPNDGGMLDVVGFDTAAPSILADFSRGEV